MKISENWLREWVNPELTTEQLVSQLTMAGLEVDSVEAAAPALDKLVVAEVISCEQHPNADRLNLCQVNDGSGEPVQVVCGAPNVAAGQKVVFAQVGAELPGFKIKKAKLRGVESNGMICSEQELGMAESSDGILVLPSDAPVATPIGDYLQLDDSLIEIDLTPNRGDCLSVAGVAREVIANNVVDAHALVVNEVPATIDDRFDVELVNPEACPHYAGRVIRGIDATADTPLWMKEKLRRSGLRPISPVVDVTNYVMMELGQPMHGFDLNKLQGGIRVRNAEAGEKIGLLDGSEVECRDDTLVIADHQAGVAIAGIMGGMDSSVQAETTDILLEAAFFSPQHIAGKARSYGMHTDSSHRFERGVDPQLQVKAIHRATELLLQMVGGQAGPVFQQRADDYMPQPPQVELRHARIERLLGIEVSPEQVESILQKLDMQVEKQADSWLVTAPSWRFDINIEADLVEEIGRIIGYDNIPGTKESAHISMYGFSERHVPLSRLSEILVARGYHEAITYSFVSPEMQEVLQPGQETLTLANPISSDMSEMRTSLLPGLIQALKHNLNRQQSRIRLFETGLCFIPQDNELLQRPHVAGLVMGSVDTESWTGASQAVDFYDIKGDLESLMALANGGNFSFLPSANEILHPGQSADVLYQGQKVGFVGALHPSVLKKLDIDHKVYVFDVESACLQQAELAEFVELSKFPSIRRDLALIIDQDISAQQMIDTIFSIKSQIIQDVFVFDVYTGKEVIKNRKSVALGLILQDFSRTLTDKDVDQTVTEVLTTLEKQHNAVLR
ncbi:MAG: phenylalanine--tRNA ligase subunit beta [Gammaproteobacteria bacterium]|nr:phenylalanine--tRNA ligase subunit beta [Gammaproteobacteria bacterium]